MKPRAAFRINGTPVGWTAPKQGRNIKTGKRITYQTPQLKRWQGEIIAQVCNFRPIIQEGPLFVSLFFYLKKPKSSRDEFPIRKPDLDNLIKSTIDAMKKLVFRDDNIIVEVRARKFWCNSRIVPYGGKPGVDIAISIIEKESAFEIAPG